MADGDADEDNRGDDWFGSCVTEGTHVSVGPAETQLLRESHADCPSVKEFIEEDRELDRSTPGALMQRALCRVFCGAAPVPRAQVSVAVTLTQQRRGRRAHLTGHGGCGLVLSISELGSQPE